MVFKVVRLKKKKSHSSSKSKHIQDFFKLHQKIKIEEKEDVPTFPSLPLPDQPPAAELRWDETSLNPVRKYSMKVCLLIFYLRRFFSGMKWV